MLSFQTNKLHDADDVGDKKLRMFVSVMLEELMYRHTALTDVNNKKDMWEFNGHSNIGRNQLILTRHQEYQR